MHFKPDIWQEPFSFSLRFFFFCAFFQSSTIVLILIDTFCLFIYMVSGIQMLIYIAEAMTSPIGWICDSSIVRLLAQAFVNVIRLMFVRKEELRDIHLCSIVRPTCNSQPPWLPSFDVHINAHFPPPISLEHHASFSPHLVYTSLVGSTDEGDLSAVSVKN